MTDPEATPLPTLSTATPLPTPLPPGSWDTHFHIFPPSYALASTPMFVPPRIPPSAEVDLHTTLGTPRTVLVHSFTFGSDLSSTTDWLALDKANRRAIAVLADDAGAEDVKRLHEAGVRGVRALLGKGSAEERVERLNQMCTRLDAAGVRWTVCVQELDGGFVDALAASMPSFSTQQVIMVDHMAFLPGPWTEGYAGPAIQDVEDVPHVQSLLTMLAGTSGPEVAVKLSAPYRCTLSGASSYHRLEPLVRALAAAAPRRIIFGTDWPHTPLHADMAASRAAGSADKVIDFRSDEDMALWLSLLRQWLGEDAFGLMMVDNPAGLYA